MRKIPSIGCILFALAGVAAGCSSQPAGSGDPAAATLVTDDTTSRSAGDQGSPRSAPHSAASTGAVAVRYVVDPADSAQLAVSAGTQAATPAPASSARAPGAVRRELK